MTENEMGIAESGLAMIAGARVESEVEKAAAEAYPPGYTESDDLIEDYRAHFIEGWEAHASLLSPPTREELAAWFDPQAWDESLREEAAHRHTSFPSYDQALRHLNQLAEQDGRPRSLEKADAILARFSLSAPEECPECGEDHLRQQHEIGESIHGFEPVPAPETKEQQ